MKAVVLTKFGPPEVLQLQDVPRPVPNDHEVLIRIRASTVTAGDSDLRSLRLPLAYRMPFWIYMRLGRHGPTILGQEVAGDVEAVGGGVTRFRAGDPVVGWTGFRLGGYAEFACMSENGAITAKPSTLTYAEAAPLAVGGLEAAHAIRKGNLRPGEEILIVGAGGSIGTYGVQLAKEFGARVTAVDRPEKLDMLRTIGADRVIDYTREDYTRSGPTYDVVFDVIGKLPASRGVRLLRRGGRYLMGNPRMTQKIRARWASARAGTIVIPYAAKTSVETAEDFRFLRELIEAGKLVSVIDRSYPLEQTAEAHRYVDTGQKKGHVVITVSHEEEGRGPELRGDAPRHSTDLGKLTDS